MHTIVAPTLPTTGDQLVVTADLHRRIGDAALAGDAARNHPLRVESAPHEMALPLVECSDVWFSGFGGHRVHALHLRPSPAAAPGPVPVVVQFLGYGDGTGTPLDWLALPAAGFATLVVDTRGQGARARRPKELVVYPWNQHEGGGAAQDEATISWLRGR